MLTEWKGALCKTAEGVWAARLGAAPDGCKKDNKRVHGSAHEGTIGSESPTAGDLRSGLCEWLLHTRFVPAGEAGGVAWGQARRLRTANTHLPLALLEPKFGGETVFFLLPLYGGKFVDRLGTFASDSAASQTL